MNYAPFVVAAAMLVGSGSAFAMQSNPPAEVSCQQVLARPSLYNSRIVAECRQAAAPLGYAASPRQIPIVTRDSSCADVRANPSFYSEMIRSNCGGAPAPDITDWGGAITR